MKRFRKSGLAAPHPVNGGFDHGFHAADEIAVGGDQSLLGLDHGDDGALDACIYANSVTVFLSYSEQSFLNDRLRWYAKSKSNRAEKAG